MMSYRVILPMTAQCLRPNVKAHWAKIAEATRNLRFLSCVAFRKSIPELLDRNFLPFKQLKIEQRFVFKLNRRRDKSNLNASTKAIEDGMVDSGLVADDSGDNIIWCDSLIVVDENIGEDYIEYLIEAT